MSYEIQYGSSSSEREITCDTNASWNSTIDAKSFNGILVNGNGGPINWKSRKQKIALSTMESELNALSRGLKEV